MPDKGVGTPPLLRSVVTRTYPVACPICGGCGTVPHDFYTRLGQSTSTARETCHHCSGGGVSWATETVANG